MCWYDSGLDTMNRTSPATLLDLPRELLHNIVVECNPEDIAAVNQTCRTLHNSIVGDKLIYRDVYLRHYVSNILKK